MKCVGSKRLGYILQKNLNQSSKQLANSEEELRKCRYGLKERDFIICEQKKAGIFNYISPFYACYLLLRVDVVKLMLSNV